MVLSTRRRYDRSEALWQRAVTQVMTVGEGGDKVLKKEDQRDGGKRNVRCCLVRCREGFNRDEREGVGRGGMDGKEK